MFNFFKTITSLVMIIGFISSATFADSRVLRLGDHLNFNDVNIGESVTRDFILYNDGDSNLTIYGLHFHEKLEGVYSGGFSGVITPGSSKLITITFTPIEEKASIGLVYVDSDRTNSNDRSRVLQGVGIDNHDNRRILEFGSHLNFGDVNIGESVTRELILYNTGSSILHISGLRFHERIEGIYSGNFSGEIAPGASQSISITFSPTENKTYSGLVYVVSNKTNIDDESSRSLVGNGLSSEITTRILKFDSNLDFGNVAIGNTVTKTLTLRNEGNSVLTISGLKFHQRLDGAYSGNFVGIIPAGGSINIPITFSPTEEKMYKGLVYVSSDKTNSGDRSRLLKGVAVNPVTSCTGELANRVLKLGSHLDFGNVTVGETATRNLMIYNEGECPLSIEKLRFHEYLEGAYTGTFSGIILAGDSVAVPIIFTPIVEKEYNGLIYVESDKTNSLDRSRLLTGAGNI